MPSTESATPPGHSSQSGTRLTGAWGDDAGADPGAALEFPPRAGDAAVAVFVLGIVPLVATPPDETLPPDGELEAVKAGDADPTAPVLVVAGVGADAAP